MSRVRLDRLLLDRGLFDSRARAQAAVAAGLVRVAGEIADRPGRLVEPDAALDAQAEHPWVGRGALKLLAALDRWPIQVAGRHVLDIGASTGGFTEVCLARGATHVVAVDVGRGQLHPRLAADPRVTALSGRDVRSLVAADLPAAPELVVCDASFIGLLKVLPPVLALAAPAAELVALVKPQFEVGPERVGKGGLVRDPSHRATAVAAVVEGLAALGWTTLDTAESPIVGGEGQVEHLLWARRA